MFLTTKPIGQPVLFPSITPLSSSTSSASLRAVVMRLCPGRRLFSSSCIKARSMGIPAGIPSTTPPTAAPWLSPKVESVNICPILLRIAFFRTISDNVHNRNQSRDDGGRRNRSHRRHNLRHSHRSRSHSLHRSGG